MLLLLYYSVKLAIVACKINLIVIDDDNDEDADDAADDNDADYDNVDDADGTCSKYVTHITNT